MCALASAHADKRVALVIGNDRYANLPAHEQLQKAANDARAVGGALRQIGFEVLTGENLGRAALVDSLDELVRRLLPGDTAFFFFSGHGVALDGVNYVLPADVPDVAAGQDTRMKGAAISEPYIISELTGRGVRVAVVVLDACRTNPFARSGAKGIGGDKGLAPPPQVKGVFSLYAASSGQAARDRLSDDDRDPNSVFSRVLVPMLKRPGLDLTALAFEVREQVARIAQKAGYDQRPAYYDETIGGRIYLAGAPPANTAAGDSGIPIPQAGPAVDEVAWSILKDTGNAEQIRRFIAQFPASSRRREAEERLKSMEQTNVTMLPLRPVPGKTEDRLPTGAPPGATGPAERERAAQKAILYEEDPANPTGVQFAGTVIWRIERLVPIPGQKPEVVVRGDIVIPGRQVSALLSLRRNDDKQIPASHTIEITFRLPSDFPHGSIANVPGVLLKSSETDRGVPLSGLAVKVTNNFFLVGLSSEDAAVPRNLELLKERSWFDIPVVYGDGKRAILAVEKGAPGERAFSEAFASWEQAGVIVPGAARPVASPDDPKRVQTMIIRADQGTASAPDRPASQPARQTAAAAPGTPAAAPVETGGYVVQLSSQRSEAEAQESFRRLQEKYSSVLSGREPLIRRRDLGVKGIFYSAYVGPFRANGEAAQLCEQLKAVGGSCLVLKL